MAGRGRAMSRLWPDDEEMAKKDDDHNRRPHPRSTSVSWQAARMPRRRFIARLAAYAFVITMLVMAIVHVFGSPNHGAMEAYEDVPRFKAPKLPETHFPPDQDKGKRTYTGPVKLPALGESLHAIAATGGSNVKNRNVLFAAASLRSASTILPIACEMAVKRHNYVHFAFMGKTNIPMSDLLKMNGVDDECGLILHDARTDHVETSPDSRLMVSTARAMFHVNTYMHPQAILVDSSRDEEHFLLAGIRDEVRRTKSALIELPEKPEKRLSWITNLDSGALAAWDKVHVDILVHAPPTGSGNMIRLLRSLSKVDLSGTALPHLTIELPQVVEPELERMLKTFQWPPRSHATTNLPNMLSLRHRVVRKKMTEEESSVRFLESFWPAQPANSHVLVLSSHTEVTPEFFHYVKYSLLHYRHSNAATILNWNDWSMGISLTAPTTLLDASKPFTSPTPADGKVTGDFVVWQAPSSHATIFPGERWMELHGYISQVLERQSLSSSTSSSLLKKEISKSQPSWLEYVLQLSRLRGYVTIYPGAETAAAILGVHTDLRDTPEEYADDEENKGDKTGAADEVAESFDSVAPVNLLNILPKGGALPSIQDLPILSWDGLPIDVQDLGESAGQYTVQFRREVGQCTEDDDLSNPATDKYAKDLFCKISPTKDDAV